MSDECICEDNDCVEIKRLSRYQLKVGNIYSSVYCNTKKYSTEYKISKSKLKNLGKLINIQGNGNNDLFFFDNGTLSTSDLQNPDLYFYQHNFFEKITKNVTETIKNIKIPNLFTKTGGKYRTLRKNKYKRTKNSYKKSNKKSIKKVKLYRPKK